MKKGIPGNISNWLFGLGTLVLPVALFFFLLEIELPSVIIKSFSSFKITHFLGLMLVFLVIFQFKNKTARLIGLMLTAVLFALPMAFNLTNGISNARIIAGFIPYKDGFYYYNGANMLLAGQRITPDGLQGAFRPLFPGWLSILLLLTNQNLLLALGIMTLITAYCCFFASDEIHAQFGPFPAAVFFTLTYAFIRPMLGDTLTELPSLAFACLSLILLMKTAHLGKFTDALLGGVMLVLAISIRAGAFFMLPLLVLWLGWRLRGTRKISLPVFVGYAAILLAVFLFANMLFTRLVTEQGDSTFGNFSWMLYGQAVGGAGFNYHLEALGTHDSTIVLPAALERIRAYPQGLLIGFAKSYRDFFSNNSLGMFDLLSEENAVGGLVFWLSMSALLVYGLVQSVHKIKQPLHALLLACFAGLLFSIPFLPPIDGGNRFYSGSVPFLFALMVIHLPALRLIGYENRNNIVSMIWVPLSRGLAIIFTLALLLGPLLILNFRPLYDGARVIECEEDMSAVQLEYSRGSYVDILPDDVSDCGISPDLCLSTFANHGADQANDEFFNLLVETAEQSEQGIRVWAGVEWMSGRYYFMILPLDQISNTSSGKRFGACAQKCETQFQQILFVQSIPELQ